MSHDDTTRTRLSDLGTLTLTTELSEFLRPFSPDVVTEVSSLAGRSCVIETGDELRHFRLEPRASLARLAIRLEAELQPVPPERIIWCQTGDPGNGLDGDELAAILGGSVSITSVRQWSGPAEKRVLAIGVPRRELIAVTYTAPATASADQLRAFLGGCQDSRSPQPMVFVAPRILAGVEIGSEVATALAQFTANGGGIALLVSAADTDAALSDPAACLRPFQRLGLSVRMTKFERGAAIEPVALDRFMRVAALACDTSVPAGSRSAHDLVRSGAYSGAAPYRPQPFDLRVPWFHTDPTMWIELPSFEVTGTFEAAFRAHLRGTGDDELAKRLDANRMAAFYRASAISPELDREYPQYRIYNWPRPAPGTRVSMLDGGVASAERQAEVDRLIARLADLRLSRVSQDDLIDAARTEVVERYGLSSAAAIDVQNATHAYLADIPRYGALRQDYADFARFAPAALGTTLEIGSGYGVLAWALSTRATRYVCADLDARMFRGLRRDLSQSGVVADAHQMPFAEDAFDSIVANNVIEHFYDPLAALREILRVLRPGGRLLALLPFDALDNRHDLPAHLWKIDESGLRRALLAAGFDIARLEIVNLHALGVPGAFPSCHGFAAMVDAQKPVRAGAIAAAATARRDSVRLWKDASERAGRVWPSVRELVRFEQWNEKRVVTVAADAEDVNEFRHFGANVIEVGGDVANWEVTDGAADLVYLFLSASKTQLPQVAAEMRRVLAPNGVVVAVFRNRGGLRHLARVGSYFGGALELDALVGRDAVAQLADDDGALGADAYVSIDDVESGFNEFAHRSVSVNNLVPEDLATDIDASYPEGFWDWLAQSCGRFVMVRAQR